MRGVLVAMGLVLVLGGCGTEDASPRARAPATSAGSPSATPTAPASPSPTPGPVLMPDLVGLPSTTASRRIARLGQGGSEWRSTTITSCAVRPETIVRQQPAPRAELGRRDPVVWTGRIDLARFRGPCEVDHGSGPDAEVARAFYRFAADPALGAPLADEVWVGIEGGAIAATTLDAGSWSDLSSWQVGEFYAERSGPFSPLDVLALSGGYYELRRGVLELACTPADVPPELAGLRALTLSARAETTHSCMDWWGVTLFLDESDLIRGVALRLGSP